MILEILFWICAGLLFYTYIGYGAIMALLVRIKRAGSDPEQHTAGRPTVALIVPAYNEEDIILSKLQNCRDQDYCDLNIYFITDGCTDGTVGLLQGQAGITLMHKAERRGKSACLNRIMGQITEEIAVFTDANTLLATNAVSKLVEHYNDPQVGAVSGEKRVDTTGAQLSGKGEGMYWRYESLLKKWDAEWHTLVGAAGELFSVRTALYKPIPEDSLLDDFMISLNIALAGYKVAYEPEAYALEKPSFNVKEEMKRKVRIAAGGFQSISRLTSALNPFHDAKLAFQYISHRVLRWTIAPLALLAIIPINLLLVPTGIGIYQIAWVFQVLFYLLAFSGFILGERSPKIVQVPYYFSMMNQAVFMGFARSLKGEQSVLWEKAKRAL